MTKDNPFKYFRTSHEIIRLAVMMYVRFPLSLRNVEDLLHEPGIDIRYESVPFWWIRFGPMFAAEIRTKRAEERHFCSRQKFKLRQTGCVPFRMRATRSGARNASCSDRETSPVSSPSRAAIALTVSACCGSR
mgnify:CR=1 FL=1